MRIILFVPILLGLLSHAVMAADVSVLVQTLERIDDTHTEPLPGAHVSLIGATTRAIPYHEVTELGAIKDSLGIAVEPSGGTTGVLVTTFRELATFVVDSPTGEKQIVLRLDSMPDDIMIKITKPGYLPVTWLTLIRERSENAIRIAMIREEPWQTLDAGMSFHYETDGTITNLEGAPIKVRALSGSGVGIPLNQRSFGCSSAWLITGCEDANCSVELRFKLYTSDHPTPSSYRLFRCTPGSMFGEEANVSLTAEGGMLVGRVTRPGMYYVVGAGTRKGRK